MASRESSIVYKGIDELTGTITTIRNSNRAFNKDLEESARLSDDLRKRQEALIKQISKTQTEMLDAGRAVKDAKKEYENLRDETSKTNLTKANEQYNKLKEGLRDYESAAKDTRRALSDLNEQQRKSANASPMEALAQAGITKMVGDLAANAANAMVGSAFGQEAGTMFSSALSGAASGAALGSFLPGIGTAVGAVVGGYLGALGGGIEIFQQQDEAFKSYVQDVYQSGKEETEAGIKSGSVTAGARETVQLSFNTLLGSEDAATDFLSDVLTMADKTPFGYDELVGISKTMLTFGYAVEDILPNVQKLGDAGAALGLSTSDIDMAGKYIGRMYSTDKATAEYLNPLQERGFDVYGWLAESMGISQKELMDKLRKGDVSGTYAADVIFTKFGELYGGMMEVQARSFEGLTSTLEGLKENLDASYGIGYNEERKEGINAEIEAYDGRLGNHMEELNSIRGSNQAYFENLEEQYLREARAALMLGEETSLFSEEQSEQLRGMFDRYVDSNLEYAKGNEEAGIAMDYLEREVVALAKAAYDSSDQVQMLKEAEIDHITALQKNTEALIGWKNDYDIQQTLSKGRASVWKDNTHEELYNRPEMGIRDDTSLIQYNAEIVPFDISTLPGHAFGLHYVPFDNYPALLHEGERVLTASQARQADYMGISAAGTRSGYAGGFDYISNFPALHHVEERTNTAAQARQANSSGPSVVVQVSGNSFVGSDPDMEERVAQLVARRTYEALLLLP